MKQEIISIETAKKLEEYEKKEKQIKEAIKFIEENCIYDKHLQGYCFGLKPGQVKQLVLKLGGRNEERSDN